MWPVLDQQLQGGNNGDIAGTTIVDVNEGSASQQLRNVAYGVVNGLIDQMQATYIGDSTTYSSTTGTGEVAVTPVSETTTDTTIAATAATAATSTTTIISSALDNIIDGDAISERVRQVALSLVSTLFDRLAEDGGVRRRLRGVTSESDVPLMEHDGVTKL
jgi:hypothetical protein